MVLFTSVLMTSVHIVCLLCVQFTTVIVLTDTVLVSVIVRRSVFFFNQSIYLDQTTWIHIIIKEKAR